MTVRVGSSRQKRAGGVQRKGSGQRHRAERGSGRRAARNRRRRRSVEILSGLVIPRPSSSSSSSSSSSTTTTTTTTTTGPRVLVGSGVVVGQQRVVSRWGLSTSQTLIVILLMIATFFTCVSRLASALAEFGVIPGSVEAVADNRDGSLDFQAGSHPFTYTVGFAMKKSAGGKVEGEVRDIVVDLPAGVIGDPNATPRCPRQDFEGQGPRCKGTTQIGIEHANIEGLVTTTGPIYNLIPPPGVPAQIGFSIANFNVFEGASVRTGDDYGVAVTSNNVPKPGALVSVSETIWGVPMEESHDSQRQCIAPLTEQAIIGCGSEIAPRPFLTLPTSCTGPLKTTVSVDSEEAPGAFVSESGVTRDGGGSPAGLAGCEKLPFEPSLSVTPDTTSTESPSGLNVSLEVPQPESTGGLAESNLKEAVVMLPAGMTVSSSAANGLGACSLEQIGLDNASAPSCPDSSKVGSVEIQTPLLEHPLLGSVFVAQQGNLLGNGSNPFGSLLALYIVAEGEGALIKIPGEIELDETTGQLRARFGEDPITTLSTGESQFLPQQPFSDLKMSFFGGPRAPLVTPTSCGTYTATSRLTPWSGGPPAEPSSSFTIDQGCGSGGFSPSFTAGTANNQAAGFSPFSVTFSRRDGEQRFGSTEVVTPPGLLAILKSAAQCPEPQASKGECGEASQLGETTVAAGPGEDPYWVKGGRVFLTGPYEGAPFGLSIVVPAVAGPFNLGTNGRPVVVRAKIEVDSHTAQAIITSDPLPTILQGIPLDVRTVNVTINRSGFMFNPTNCTPLSITGTLRSTTGTNTPVSAPFEAANCAGLPYKPSLKISTQAKTSKASGASLLFRIATGNGQSNTSKLKLTFPKQLPARLTTLQKACVDKVFDANPAACPGASDIGTATVHTPVLAGALTGPIYLVSHGGAAFPDAVLVLQGEGVTIYLDGNTNIKKGITTSTFNSVPDAPFSSFEAVVPEGPHSAFTTDIPAKAKGNLCAQKLTMPATFTGQNGAVLTQTTKITVTGCPKTKKAKKTTKKHNKKK